MNTRILPALKACLTDGLADLHLLGQTAEDDAVQPVQVFIGDLPPPENGRISPLPCARENDATEEVALKARAFRSSQ